MLIIPEYTDILCSNTLNIAEAFGMLPDLSINVKFHFYYLKSDINKMYFCNFYVYMCCIFI